MANAKPERREDCPQCGSTFRSCQASWVAAYEPCCSDCKHEEKKPQVQSAQREMFGQVHAGS